MGYGLVVGLAGTGDRRQTVFSAQSLTNLLARMGLTVSPTTIQVKNTAAVMVTVDAATVCPAWFPHRRYHFRTRRRRPACKAASC